MTLARPGTCSCNFGTSFEGLLSAALLIWHFGGRRWMDVDGPVLTLLSTAPSCLP